MKVTPIRTKEEPSTAKSAGNSTGESIIGITTSLPIHSGSRTIKGRNEIMKLLLAKFKAPKKVN